MKSFYVKLEAFFSYISLLEFLKLNNGINCLNISVPMLKFGSSFENSKWDGS